MSGGVYLPSSAAGNSRALATFGGAGEVMAFFYPHLDFARNVREAMPAVYVHEPQRPRLLWCFDEGFQRRQGFASGSNVLVTRLRHDGLDLTVEITDAVPPGSYALVRRVRLQRGPATPPVQFLHYFKLALGDVDGRNAVHRWPDTDTIVQQFRDINLAVAGDGRFSFQTGSMAPGRESGVKQALTEGRFDGSDQCMGNVDFAVALPVAKEAEWSGTIVLAGARTRQQAALEARRAADTPFDTHVERCCQRSGSILAAAPPCSIDEFREAYQRSILVLHDLYDEPSGAFIAAPEFDPGYALSGGYGYCWPRDGAVVALTAARLGFVEMAERFFDWCARTQLDDGHWYQRYWTNGAEAPSWCVRPLEIQLDQTCAVLHAASIFADLPGIDRCSFVEHFRSTAQRAAKAIRLHVDETGLHKQAADLWECAWGSFAYTQAAVWSALAQGHRVFGTPAEGLDRIRGALFERFWMADRKCWARQVDASGRVDHTLDSSCLGVIEPWNVLDLDDRADLEQARAMCEVLSSRLSAEVRGGKAILRFENETYMGGGAGCVNTLWMALCRLMIAARLEGPARQRETESARALMRTALANTNPTGQLPELIPNQHYGYWAAPHGWASALFIECVRLAESLT